MFTMKQIVPLSPENISRTCKVTFDHIKATAKAFRDFNRFMTHSKEDIAERLVRRFLSEYRHRSPSSSNGQSTELLIKLPATLIDEPYIRKIEAALSNEADVLLKASKCRYSNVAVVIQKDTYCAETGTVQIVLTVEHS